MRAGAVAASHGRHDMAASARAPGWRAAGGGGARRGTARLLGGTS